MNRHVIIKSHYQFDKVRKSGIALKIIAEKFGRLSLVITLLSRGLGNELIDRWQFSPSHVLFYFHPTAHSISKSNFSCLDLSICDFESAGDLSTGKSPFCSFFSTTNISQFHIFRCYFQVDIHSTRKCLLISSVRFQSTLKISNMLSHLFSLTETTWQTWLPAFQLVLLLPPLSSEINKNNFNTSASLYLSFSY